MTDVAELPLQDGTFAKQLQGSHELSFSTRSASKLDLRIGDTLTYKGEVMTINKEPGLAKLSSLQYSTTVVFQGLRHSLERYILKDEGALTFDYFGTLSDFLLMFLESVNLSDSGWTLGDVEVTEPTSLSFDRVYCFSALNMVAQAFSCEWQIVGKQISVKKTVGQVTGINLAYGKDNGLYSLSLEAIDNARIVNRAFGSGGSNNLPQGYGKKNLQLDAPIEDATSIAMYGVREGAFHDETIFPNRTSTATTVAKINDDTYQIEDATIDFDLNGQRIDGTEAKIVFKSGALIGQEFKIISYNHANKRIRYEANKDSNGELSPKDNMVAEVGDQYTLIGIRMPSAYVDAALLELSAKTTEYLNSNKIPRVLYKLDIDILDAKRKATYPNEGDFIHVVDSDLGIDDDIRVTSIEYPALFPVVLVQGMKFNCEVGNDITYTFTQKIEKDIKETKEVVTVNRNQSIELNRRSVTALNEFRNMVFDPDGNLQQPMIEAMAGFFGTKSQYFDLDGVTMIVNYEDDSNKLFMSEGNLIHYSYEIPTIGNVWAIAGMTLSGLVSDKPYYISLKASRTVPAATWDVSLVKRLTDEDPDYWYFNFGVLSSVIENNRSIRPTNMFTAISGGTVETNILIAKMLMLPYMSIGKNGENAQRFYYDIEQQKTGALFGIIEGKPQLKWYDENGIEIWNASKNGIVYVTASPESWRAEGVLLVQSIATESENLDDTLAKSTLQLNATKTGPETAFIGNETVVHFYDPGANENTTGNAVYEGYHIDDIKTSNFIANGYYTITGITPDYKQIQFVGGAYFMVEVIKVWNGKVIGGTQWVEIYLP